MGHVTATKATDHIIPHRGDQVLFWDPDNRQPACAWHHSVVKQVLERRFERGEVTQDDLRLDSAVAVATAYKLREGGVDLCRPEN